MCRKNVGDDKKKSRKSFGGISREQGRAWSNTFGSNFEFLNPKLSVYSRSFEGKRIELKFSGLTKYFRFKIVRFFQDICLNFWLFKAENCKFEQKIWFLNRKNRLRKIRETSSSIFRSRPFPKTRFFLDVKSGT